MQVDEFVQAPTKKRHPSYAQSMFATAAPEDSTGEVLLASAYRGLLLGVTESKVDLANILLTPARMDAAVGGPELWEGLLFPRGALASPLRRGKHTTKAAQQLMPLVPAISRIAGVLGEPRSRWTPFNLLLETIGAGAGPATAPGLLTRLGDALTISPQDDLFARFVETSLRDGLQGVEPIPAANPPYAQSLLDPSHFLAFRTRAATSGRCPSERFCLDLDHVLALKPSLTRRQWTVLVEAALRLGLGMYVLWNCRANAEAWRMACAVASGEPVPTMTEVENALWPLEPESRPLLEIGANAQPLLERLIEEYAYARTGLNYLLCRLDDVGVPWTPTQPLGFDAATATTAPVALRAFLDHVSTNRQLIDAADGGTWLRSNVAAIFDKELRELAQHSTGYTRNLYFFTLYSLGQIQTKDPEQRSYDLAYLFAYVGNRKPLPVQPGPDMLVMLVHACCMATRSLPMALDDFRQHLAEYGLHVPAGELTDGKTGRDLVRLGLVVDSPDAAGGRLLVPPFS